MKVNKYMYNKPDLVNNYVDKYDELTAALHNNKTNMVSTNMTIHNIKIFILCYLSALILLIGTCFLLTII